VPGIAGDADINVFNGSPEQWRRWLGSTMMASN
jgi:GH25 family lysozyme M1 (1,4-beta-N-acetylmuramidase)